MKPMVLVLMGVSGSGKTTVGAALGARLGWRFQEGDDLHPQANIDKMAAGRPLDDSDRRPWLAKVSAWVDERLDAGESGLIACSALKRSYRQLIDRRGSGVRFVYLAVPRDAIAARLASRRGHFMPAALLDSQLADLEEPGADEPAIRVDGDAAEEEIVERIIRDLGLATA